MAVNISLPCHGHGQYLILHSEKRQWDKCKTPCVIPFCNVLVYGNVLFFHLFSYCNYLKKGLLQRQLKL